MNSQSALRAEADSDDDSELSLSLFREGSERTSFFWPNQKVYKSNITNETIWKIVTYGAKPFLIDITLLTDICNGLITPDI